MQSLEKMTVCVCVVCNDVKYLAFSHGLDLSVLWLNLYFPYFWVPEEESFFFLRIFFWEEVDMEGGIYVFVLFLKLRSVSGGWGIGAGVLVGILPSSQESEMKSISLKKPSVDAMDNIFTQPGAHLGEALATATLRKRSWDRRSWGGRRRDRMGRRGTGQSALRGRPSPSQTLAVVTVFKKFINVAEAGILIKCFEHNRKSVLIFPNGTIVYSYRWLPGSIWRK